MIELNPFGPATGASLFTWEHDRRLLQAGQDPWGDLASHEHKYRSKPRGGAAAAVGEQPDVERPTGGGAEEKETEEKKQQQEEEEASAEAGRDAGGDAGGGAMERGSVAIRGVDVAWALQTCDETRISSYSVAVSSLPPAGDGDGGEGGGWSSAGRRGPVELVLRVRSRPLPSTGLVWNNHWADIEAELQGEEAELQGEEAELQGGEGGGLQRGQRGATTDGRRRDGICRREGGMCAIS